MWDHIPVSYDKDEMHPNSDMTSLFPWQHQAQVEHMDQFQKKEELVRGCYECKNKVAEGAGGGQRWPGRPVDTAGCGVELGEETGDVLEGKEHILEIGHTQ